MASCLQNAGMIMAQLTVRNVPAAVVDALKARAARAGRSAEAEHRRILEEVLSAAPAAVDFFAEARARRIRLPLPAPDTTALLRRDRDRDDPERR
jgi:plasmid stability protein